MSVIPHSQFGKSFTEAVADIGSIGMRISLQPVSGERATYGIVGGRTNARWWLIPLHNGRVAASGLALFQPILAGPRCLKWIAGKLSLLGLSRFWAKQKVYISGQSGLENYFPEVTQPCYAYFTGTDSPHRKLAVQIMDNNGGIKGFAKISRNPEVTRLLRHEGEILRRVSSLRLQNGHIPNVVFLGKTGEATLLVTDTMKTAATRTVTRFSYSHQAFLQELAEKTSLSAQPIAAVAERFAARLQVLRPDLDAPWWNRLNNAVAALAVRGGREIALSFSHGDFTPWNTFLVHGKLYVFDWEYAEDNVPPSNDLIHFALNEPQLRNKPAAQKLAAVSARLNQSTPNREKGHQSILQLIYWLTQVFRQMERLPEDLRKQGLWDGANEQAEMLDMLVERLIA